VIEGVGLLVGIVGPKVVGLLEGLTVVGDTVVGAMVGCVGLKVGPTVGDRVAQSVGLAVVGELVGLVGAVGAIVGDFVGAMVNVERMRTRLWPVSATRPNTPLPDTATPSGMLNVERAPIPFT